MHLLGRLTVDFAFGNCDTMEDSDRLLLHPIREAALSDQVPNLRVVASVLVLMLAMVMLMPVFVMVLVMFMLVLMPLFMMMIILQVNVEFRSLDICLLAFGGVNVEFLQTQFVQRLLQLPEIHSQVEHGADEHVAADPAEHVQIKRFHSSSP